MNRNLLAAVGIGAVVGYLVGGRRLSMAAFGAAGGALAIGLWTPKYATGALPEGERLSPWTWGSSVNSIDWNFFQSWLRDLSLKERAEFTRRVKEGMSSPDENKRRIAEAMLWRIGS